ncbi:MAG: phosphoribosylamine--glycine ligase [Synergistaceae bacterium]|nr:phosphoribosylamine--glycine ligase [Synergistaceae bacterium]
MNVMVVGGGGREHALISCLARSPKIEKLYALPGNGGIANLAECAPVPAEDIDGLCAFAAGHAVDFAVVAPDDPLVLGAVDRLEAQGVRCFGPNAAAAAIEGSKVFAKSLMRKYGIPTADYEVFDDAERALSYIDGAGRRPLVVKADGLAKGKGVVVAEDREQAKAAVLSCMRDKAFGASGERIVIEEKLSGPEVTVLAFTDGRTLIPMISSMDHKRAYDGNVGPNTGGMGVIAPNPHYTTEIAETCMKTIFLPTIEAMKKEGHPFKGCLYFGLMLTEDGPKVIEYNCRFGDPEAQAVLPLLESDLFEILLAVREERLDKADVRFSGGASCCVVLASREYPGSCKTGLPIDLGGADRLPDVSVFHAGTRLEDGAGGKLLTAGGRVLAVTATAGDLAGARARAYEAIGRVHFDGARYRKDIGAYV